MVACKDSLNLVGTTVADKYDVERCVGDGGFSVVYRAVHRIWREPVALKCFTALSTATEETKEALVESFIREGKIMSQLSSQTASVTQARDMGSLNLPDGRWIPYLVLEWLEGATLSSILDSERTLGKSPRTLSEIVRLLQGPIEALCIAHAMGVAHLDVKPDNLFVCGESLREGVTTKILDFGVSKVLDRRHVRSGEYSGTTISSLTPDYAAPEQYDAQYGPTGASTDVFAFALVLLEVMRGGIPVIGDGLDLTPEGIAAMRARSEDAKSRPTPRTLNLEVNDSVEAVFRKALAVQPTDRYSEMAEFYESLCRAMGMSRSREKRIVRPTRVGNQALEDAREQAMDEESESKPRAPKLTPSMTWVAAGSAAEEETSDGDTQEFDKNSSISAAPRAHSMGTADIRGTHLHEETVEDSMSDGSLVAVVPGGKNRKFAMVGAAAALCGIVVAAVFAEFPSGNRGNGEGETKQAGIGGVESSKDESTSAVSKPKVIEAPLCPPGMAFIPGGKFYMGSDEDHPVLALAKPSHQVEIESYCMDVHEVTVDEYRACSRIGECKRAFRDSFWPQGGQDRKPWEQSRKAYSKLCNENFEDRGNHPVNCVSWEQAQHFCTRQGKSLPTEEQWEFAGRGSDGRVFPWGDEDPDYTRMNGCGVECSRWREQAGLEPGKSLYEVDDGFPGTSPVGFFKAGTTQHGLVDMVGNVFEWTADPFITFEEKLNPSKGKRKRRRGKKAKNDRRAIRGGGFNSNFAKFGNPALRFAQHQDAHVHAIGFRCAATPLRQTARDKKLKAAKAAKTKSTK